MVHSMQPRMFQQNVRDFPLRVYTNKKHSQEWEFFIGTLVADASTHASAPSWLSDSAGGADAGQLQDAATLRANFAQVFDHIKRL